MAVSSEKTLSMVEAARLIFRDGSPSVKQVRAVYLQMKSGALKVRDYGGPPLKWTTTESALADFLAAQRELRANSQRLIANARRGREPDALESPIAKRHEEGEDCEKLRAAYRNVWRDYFLAVMLRRRMEHRSQSFRRLVVVGQAVLLLLLMATFIGGFRRTFATTPPEQATIEWAIAESTDAYSITHWHPVEPSAEGNGSTVRVEYRYQKESRRWIHTDRRFEVVGDTATELPAD